MIGSRAWFALMRRNCLYRKRNWLSSIFEMILPFCFVWIMVALRNAIDTKTNTGTTNGIYNSFNTTTSNYYNQSTQSVQIPEYIPSDYKALIPFSYHDYVIALQAKRRCFRRREDRKLDISGLHNFGRNWQVPFVKCDPRKCRRKDVDASQFCEYSFLAVAGSTRSDIGGHTRAIQFQQYMYSTWPVLRPPPPSNNTIETPSILPFKFEFVQIFDSEQAIEEYIARSDYGTTNVPKLSMGIIFTGNSTTDYTYTIRQNSTNLNAPANKIEGNPISITTPPTNRLFNHYAQTDFDTCKRGPTDAKVGLFDDSCTGLYFYNGVIATQRLVGDFILHDTGASKNGYSVSDGSVSFVQFPQQAFVASGFFTTVKDTAPLLIILGLLYPVASMIGYIVQEKQLRQKELMKMMSVVESDIGWAWFITFASFNIVAAMCAAIVSSVLYEHSTTFLLCIFWILSFLATTVFCMTMAAFTSKSSRAVLIGLLVFFSGVFLTIAVDYENGRPSIIAILCLHPATTFAYGIKILGHLEDLDIGLVRHTLYFSDGRSSLSMMKIFQYLCIDIVFWGILSWYFNRVIPPDFGQALPFWFPFDINYWMPTLNRRKIHNDKDESNHICNDAPVSSSMIRNYLDHMVVPIEPVSDSFKKQERLGKSIEIRNLRKVYGDTIAVDGLNLSMYCGQITALLGHNGAGKSTTINMLTGATAPTSGHAVVAGNDIHTHMSNIRQDLGICLQHDCLFPQLTVREHIQFFARLKGLYAKVSVDEAEAQVDQALVDVALSEKRNTLSRNLSGGMKRKLSVAMAFCGGSKVVLLDEPTSGMDPFSRRFTWNLIRHYKQDRIIILTTHFMDEADVLGDRIAIMAEGQLRCVGSSLYLKKTYGVGYQLTIDRGLKGTKRDFDTSDQSLLPEDSNGSRSYAGQIVKADIGLETELTRIVKDSVRDAVLLSNVGSELSYQLPLNAASSFAPMFSELDEKVDEGCICSYGVSVTTLNEVFLMVTRGEIPTTTGTSEASTDSDDLESFQTDHENASENDDIEQIFHSKSDIEVGKSIESERYFARHVIALMKKRGLYFRRDRKAWICTTIVPSVFVFIGFLIVALTSPKLSMEPLLLDPSEYNAKLGINQISFNRPDNPFICQPGICSHRQPYNDDRGVNEKYVFCGYQAKLGISTAGFTPSNETCTVSQTSNIMSSIESDSVYTQDIGAENISEGSKMLQTTANEYPYTLYGAIWFSHFQDSFIDTNGALYNETVMGQCFATNNLVNYSSGCDRFDGVGYTIQYNYTALHAALLYEKLANEALARYGSNNSDINVEATIAPLPVTQIEQSIGAGIDSFLAWFLVVVSFPFIGGAFGSFVVHEKNSKAKHLQTVAGVEPSAYWLSTYLWDIINYQIPLWTTIVLMFCFGVDILTTSNRDIFSGILTILFLFGPALAGFTYCCSFAFKSASACNVFIITSGFLIGMGGPLTCSILIILSKDPRHPNPNLIVVANILTWILRFTPSFCLGKALFNAINIDLFIYLTGDNTLTAWTEPILLYEVYFLLGHCILFPMLAIQLDKWSSNPRMMSMWRKILRYIAFQWVRAQEILDVVSTVPDDDDVLKEQLYVQTCQANSDRIVIKNLSKVYDDGKVAVDNMSIGIAPGECFGLLGINGAGKTTTLSMLTAEFPPTNGDAFLDGFSVAREPQKIRRLIGYCPQFDALFGCLTGREHLFLYGAVKGILTNLLPHIVEKKLLEVGLNESDWDRMSKEYSGGMKRRLSLACATIGQPSLLFLDECSTGVDPISRREIWKLISGMVEGRGLSAKDKPSVILTTHNMEECEALCPRIGIMANGKLRCLGSAQHLKNKFGNGYQVELNVIIVDATDDDYRKIEDKLKYFVHVHNIADNEGFDLFKCDAALKMITDDLSLPKSLSDLLCPSNSNAYTIVKDAMSPLGVTINDLATFATSEIRILNLEMFVEETFSSFVLRERQDSKVRYEVNDKNLRISSIFASIEKNKQRLCLSDYSVSQTSLEQVFNMHAAEAEQQKAGRFKHELSMDCMTAESSVEQGSISLHDNSEVSHNLNMHDNNLELPYDERKLNLSAVSLPFDERYVP